MNIARYIDHTLLKPNATTEQIRQLCAEAREYNFFSVCVNPFRVSVCKDELNGTGIKICSVIGFPLGATTTKIKMKEAEDAIKNGANELDMVMNVGALLDNDRLAILNDIVDITNLAHKKNVLVKVIIETGLLPTNDVKILACKLSIVAGADFVKTCTGFSGGQATIEDITLMKSLVGDKAQVKASGGIRDYATALAMLEAGASRIGTSSGVKIVQEEQDILVKAQ